MNVFKLTSIFTALLWCCMVGHCAAECFSTHSSQPPPCHHHREDTNSTSHNCCSDSDHCEMQRCKPSSNISFSDLQVAHIDIALNPFFSFLLLNSQNDDSLTHSKIAEKRSLSERESIRSLVKAPNAPPHLA